MHITAISESQILAVKEKKNRIEKGKQLAK